MCRLIAVPAGVAEGPSGASIYEEQVPIFAADGNADYYLDEGQHENFRDKLAWVARYVPPGADLLDAGANYGHFLHAAKDTYRAIGFDISPSAVAYAREKFGAANTVGSIYAPPPSAAGPFAALVCFDVIEHVDDPRRALEALRDRLAPDGVMFLTTPDAGSPVARLLGVRWHYLDPIQHIVLFDRHNLGALLAQVGLRVVAERTIGHRYRMRYILDRLCYLNRGSPLDLPMRALRFLLSPLSGISVRINLGDVMGLVVRHAAPAGNP